MSEPVIESEPVVAPEEIAPTEEPTEQIEVEDPTVDLTKLTDEELRELVEEKQAKLDQRLQ